MEKSLWSQSTIFKIINYRNQVNSQYTIPENLTLRYITTGLLFYKTAVLSLPLHKSMCECTCVHVSLNKISSPLADQ